ncbi:hypothetical protein TNCV_2487371 [Trichonephila clavipes]|uniref:Uncharacterized protein n=1 Tax=Trichonephila clavipes TaxID=2585209 RepID=A0A8X6W068_TRICX|nr:hypothetical protein TNCV_2487371 [Trichonephila clavipes]
MNRDQEGHLMPVTKCYASWEGVTLPQPAYCLDIASSDYPMLMSLRNFPDGNQDVHYDGVQVAVVEHFVTKTEDFLSRRLDKLPRSLEDRNN